MRRRPKQKWTSEEEAALQAGVEKHGPGWWRVIQMDPEFRPVLSSRSNIGLKDKWRNLSPKKSISKAVPALPIPISTPLSSSPTATSPIPPSTIPLATGYERNSPKYAALILEALSILKDPNGTDLNAIYHFIEEKQRGLSSDFRSLVSLELGQLIEEDKIEKVANGYSLKKASFTPMQRDLPLPTQPTQADQTANLLSDLANSYAIKIADAEVKLIKAAEAVMEVVRFSKTAEEADSFLQRAENIFEQCFSGEIVDNGFRQHFTCSPGSLHQWN